MKIYKCYFTKLHIVLHKTTDRAALNYIQNYVHAHYIQAKLVVKCAIICVPRTSEEKISDHIPDN